MKKKILKTDKRKEWEYKDCRVVPVGNNRSGNDKYAPSYARTMNFGFGLTRRYWRVFFPDGSDMCVATKHNAREYIGDLIRWRK